MKRKKKCFRETIFERLGGAEGPPSLSPRNLRFSLNLYPQFYFSGPRTSGLAPDGRFSESLQAEPRARAARRQIFHLLRAVEGARSGSGGHFPLRKSQANRPCNSFPIPFLSDSNQAAETRIPPRAPQMAKPGGLPCRGGTMSHHAIPPNVAPRPTTKAADASVNSAKRVRRNAQRLHPKQSATSLPPPLRPPAAVGKEKSRPGRRKLQSAVASPAGVARCHTMQFHQM